MIELQRNEKLYLILRRHKLLLGFQIAVLVILAVVIWVIIAFLKNNYPTVFELYGNLIWLGLCLYYSILWLKLFIILVDYHLDASIITDSRIIDLDQISLFNWRLLEFPLDRIQDISIKISGPVETVFDFGDVILRTASESQNLILEKIPHPNQVKDIILTLVSQKRSLDYYAKPPQSNP